MVVQQEKWDSVQQDLDVMAILRADQEEADLAKWLEGEPHAALDALKKFVEPLARRDGFSFVEIGCMTGYSFPAFQSFASRESTYAGIDASQVAIDCAKKRWNDSTGGIFHLRDTHKTGFNDGTWDCACISGLIQHLKNYIPTIKEAARLAKKWVILHSVEATSEDTREFLRRAYESEIPVRQVNEDQLLFFCGTKRLRLEKTVKWAERPKHWMASYLFSKV